MKVFPTSEVSLVIKHPVDGTLSVDGSDWQGDGFTMRMLSDGAVTDDPKAAWAPAQSAVAADKYK